ncbi:orotate phosphoribosyltransferase [Halorhodospira abdelmalekii]|uniref:orotate phosphoribosyltransferase n=1 Tax=Halorhodospira abdelmalekii TaxID=421629 RepID=UPI0019041234|nr:orotate phosphoribosyltransferase [Halorhodospira abdelmalekii]MBK1734418.1 orotate phosphoribosyltransferase [Halorhodospira abdelmalekii]
MHDYQEDFIHFARERGVLSFGQFTLKSGRISPYFFNSGLFNSGVALSRLGRCYAEALARAHIDFDLVFGPAYKGIPLATALSMATAEISNRDLAYAFDRKEAKDHGEGGEIVGAPLAGRRTVIIDDVISSGGSIRAAANRICAAGGHVAAIAIALDRMERGSGDVSAVAEVEEATGAPVIAIISLDHIAAYLAERPEDKETLAAIRTYRRQYGADSAPPTHAVLDTQ